jgi:hypothetical protein
VKNKAEVSTVGGLLVNGCVQIIDENDEPIVEAYTGGCDAGGLESDPLRHEYL